ncbi:hypothetical protein ACOME3_007808 [Neoechinorhynchus agilis]
MNFTTTDLIDNADAVIVHTCSIRDGAERKVWNKLQSMRSSKSNPDLKIAVVGCMAQRLKDRLLDDGLVDVVCGPDSYRSLPRLLLNSLELRQGTEPSIATKFSQCETYADVIPQDLSCSPSNAFVPISRGCNNMCSFCIVPFTRGRERCIENVE